MQSGVAAGWAVLPFLGLLLSIALLPGLFPRFWERKMGVVASAWSLLLIPILGFPDWAHGSIHALTASWLPFVAAMGGLFTVSGGILLSGGPGGRPWGNAALLALGSVLVLVMGTTGAAMVIVRPLLRSNAHRRRRFHLVLFLILLVANVAGTVTPVGNPPLLAGMLRGVPLLWPATNIYGPWLLAVGLLLTVFLAVDTWLARSEPPPPPIVRFSLRGWSNVVLVLALAVGLLLPVSPVLPALAAGTISWWTTPRAIRQANDFTWHPMLEVAILFIGIFITLEPVSALLRLGMEGPLAALAILTMDGAGGVRPFAVFWLTGFVSAFLDNAPAYLMFFDLATIHPEALTAGQSAALRAISAGAVMFGGLTYIGNAPNLLLRNIASHRGVRMPGFLTFLAYAFVVMVPILSLVSAIFFWN